MLVADATGIKIAAQLTSGAADNVTAAETQVLAPLGGQDERPRASRSRRTSTPVARARSRVSGTTPSPR